MIPIHMYQNNPTRKPYPSLHCDINLVVSAFGVLHYNIMNSSAFLELSYKYYEFNDTSWLSRCPPAKQSTTTAHARTHDTS